MVIDLMKADPVMSSLYVTDIGYYPQASGHYRERREGIDQYVLIYCIAGQGRYELAGRSYEVPANTFFVLPKSIPHTYQADENNPWTIYWIHFDGHIAPHFAASLFTPQPVRPAINSRISNRIKLFDEIVASLNRGPDVANLRYACSVLYHFLATLCHLREYRAATAASTEASIADSLIHYISENMEHRITLAELSRFSGYSITHLSGVFRAKTGYSPMEYAAIMKVRKACELLDNTDLHVNQICYRIGIPDPYYFSRFFSKIMGVSPKNYRNRQKPI